MMAQSLEPPGAITFHPTLTILSASVATLFTFVALATTDCPRFLSDYLISLHHRLSLYAQKLFGAFGMSNLLPHNSSHSGGLVSSPSIDAERASDQEPLISLELGPLAANSPQSSSLHHPQAHSHCQQTSFSPPLHIPRNSRLVSITRTGLHLGTLLRAFVWATAIVCMHYLGTQALNLPTDQVVFAPLHLFFPTALGFCASILSCIILDCHPDLTRQILFATFITTSVFMSHYLSVMGIKFLPSIRLFYEKYERSDLFSKDILFIFSALIVVACLVSIAYLAHTASVSHSRMLELDNAKRKLAQLTMENEAVVRLAELKQNFISVASHELRTPLFSVTGYAELLARTDLNNEQRWCLGNMQQACSNMQLIIANVLDFSKLERNNAESCAKPTRVNVRTLLEGIAQMTEDRGQLTGNKRAVDLIVHVSDDVPETAMLDETFVMRICMNLLSNALKFTERGLITIEVETRNADTLVLKVLDTGIGIPHSFMSSLFEPYRQADSSTTRPHQGTGLGLSICKQLVERLHGTIDVQSEVGKGSMFIVTLPLSHPTDPPHLNNQVRRHTICLAYNERATEDKLHELLTKAGHHTIGIHNEFEVAQQLLDNGEVDLVLTDASYLHSSQLLRSHVDIRREPIGGLLACSETSEQHHWPTYVITSSTELGKKYPQHWLTNPRNVIKMRRQGIIPHLIFNLVLDAKKYAHEIDLVLTEEHGSHESLAQESVETMTSSSASSLSPSVFEFGSPTNRLSDSPNSSLSGSHASQLDVMTVQSGFEIDRCNPRCDSPSQAPLNSQSRILLVDDNPINIQLGKRLLELLGYEVASASDGFEAVKMACGSTWDLILMDCQMPGLDGKAATRLIREHESLRYQEGHRAVPIIALTANVSESDQLDCQLSGMDGFLPKPLQINVLKSTLHTFLG